MTANELRAHFNNTFGLGKWPEKFIVDAETYGNVCQEIFNVYYDRDDFYTWDVVKDGQSRPSIKAVAVHLGPNKGLYFKDVELILEPRLVKEANAVSK